MIEPTNLNDPYVIQLIEALAKRDDEIERQLRQIDNIAALSVNYGNEIREQADEIERLKAVVDAAEAKDSEIERLKERYNLLAGAVNDDGDHCDDDCDSMTHSDACNKAGTELVIRMQDRIARLQAVVDAAVIARTVDEFGLLSVEDGWALDRALANLKEST